MVSVTTDFNIFYVQEEKRKKAIASFQKGRMRCKQPTFKPLLLLVQVARSKTKVYLYIARF